MKITNFNFIESDEKIYREKKIYGHATFSYRKYIWSDTVDAKAVLKNLPIHKLYLMTSNTPVAADWYSTDNFQLLPFRFRKELDECFIKFEEDERQRKLASEIIDYMTGVANIK